MKVSPLSRTISHLQHLHISLIQPHLSRNNPNIFVREINSLPLYTHIHTYIHTTYSLIVAVVFKVLSLSIYHSISFMASPSSYSPKPNATAVPSRNAAPLDPTPPPNTTTTFVQADPSNFRAVVQKLTGANSDPSAPKLPVTLHSRLPPGKQASGEMGPRKQPFKLQERRQSGKKLELQLNNNNDNRMTSVGLAALSPRQRMMMFSPVSPLDMLFLRTSPRTPMSPVEQEERAIAHKGFYLHPSPLTTPRGSEPELLPLFPLHSPKLTHDSSSNS